MYHNINGTVYILPNYCKWRYFSKDKKHQKIDILYIFAQTFFIGDNLQLVFIVYSNVLYVLYVIPLTYTVIIINKCHIFNELFYCVRDVKNSEKNRSFTGQMV